MPNKVPGNPSQNRAGDFTPLVVVAAGLVMLYTTANIMAVKVISIGGVSLFDAGTITFPLAYVLSDALAEVWGYKTARKVIFLTFAMNILMVLFLTIGVYLPYPDYMRETQEAYALVFGYVPRIVASSLVAFLTGQLANAKILVAMRDRRGDGRFLWTRTILSSLVGYVFDTVVFVLLAFWGTAPAKDLVTMIVAQYFIKAGIEALFGTPLAYLAILWIRKFPCKG